MKRLGDQLSDWMVEKLEELYMVEWDRFISYDDEEHGLIVTVYGWVEREDEYKDFVVVKLFDDHNEVSLEVTSSEKYSEEIYEILYGDAEGHVGCSRVENHFDIENAIELDEV